MFVRVKKIDHFDSKKQYETDKVHFPFLVEQACSLQSSWSGAKQPVFPSVDPMTNLAERNNLLLFFKNFSFV